MLSGKGSEGTAEETQAKYAGVKAALTERFEAASKKELYNAERQVRTK